VLHNVAVGRWSLDAYQDVVPDAILEGLREQPGALRGARILLASLDDGGPFPAGGPPPRA
jgi:hypothetical protein